MKERGMMSQLQRLILHPLASKIFLCLLASVYVLYLVGLGRLLSTWQSASSTTIIEHPVETNSQVVLTHWTAASMRNATDAQQQIGTTSQLTAGSNNTRLGQATQQPGQPPRHGEPSYPLSTVGKVFFTNAAGQ